MTEVCCSTGSGYARGYNPGMLGGLWLADTIWRDLSAGGVSSFSWWTALSPELGCAPSTDPTCAAASNPSGWNDGLLYYDPDFRADGNQSIYFTRRYWVLANFSRYIRPGAVHYRVTGVPDHVHVIAFRRNTWRFVMINDAAGPRTVRVRLLPPGGHHYGTPSAYDDDRDRRPRAGGDRPHAGRLDAHALDDPARAQRDDGHRPLVSPGPGETGSGRRRAARATERRGSSRRAPPPRAGAAATGSR